MKRAGAEVRFLLLLLVALLCMGCLQRRSALSGPSAVEVLCPGSGVDSLQQPLGAMSDLDSILCAEGCSDYTCYFAKGGQNKEALTNIQAVIFGGFAVTDIDSDDDPATIDRYRTHLLDSLSSLEWLDFEPWTSVRQLFVEWSKQQCDRFYIISQAQRDPKILYHCSETDSVLIRGADILTENGAGYVAAVRRMLRDNEFAKSARDSIRFDRADLDRALSRINEALSGYDSTECASERLFMLLSNHINYKIHNRLGENGAVDFYKYSDGFLRIFDSVKVETYEP